MKNTQVILCSYVNVLTLYGAPELTLRFCQIDDIGYESLPPFVRWERTGTLGWGNAFCDFRYRHVERNEL